MHNQAGLVNRPDRLKTDFSSDYAACRLRNIRTALTPNGSSSNAPATIEVGSGTAATQSPSMVVALRTVYFAEFSPAEALEPVGLHATEGRLGSPGSFMVPFKVRS
jgi:hypothetical protein